MVFPLGRFGYNSIMAGARNCILLQYLTSWTTWSTQRTSRTPPSTTSAGSFSTSLSLAASNEASSSSSFNSSRTLPSSEILLRPLDAAPAFLSPTPSLRRADLRGYLYLINKPHGNQFFRLFSFTFSKCFSRPKQVSSKCGWKTTSWLKVRFFFQKVFSKTKTTVFVEIRNRVKNEEKRLFVAWAKIT